MSNQDQNINRQPSGQPTGGQFAESQRASSGIGLQAPVHAADSADVSTDPRFSEWAEHVVDEVLTPLGIRGQLHPDEYIGPRGNWTYMTVTNDAGDELRIGAAVHEVPESQNYPTQMDALTVRLGSDASEPDHAGSDLETYGAVYPGEARAQVRSTVLTSAMKEEVSNRYQDVEAHGIEDLRVYSHPQRQSLRFYNDPEPEQEPGMLAVMHDESEVAIAVTDGELTIHADGSEVNGAYLRDITARDMLTRLGVEPGDDPAETLSGEMQSLYAQAHQSPVYQRFFGSPGPDTSPL